MYFYFPIHNFTLCKKSIDILPVHTMEMYYSFLSLKYDQSIIVKTFFYKRTVVNIVGGGGKLFYFTVKSISISREQIYLEKN